MPRDYNEDEDPAARRRKKKRSELDLKSSCRINKTFLL